MIKTAVIGFGLSARVFHLPFIATSNAFQLVGISTSQPQAATCWPDVRVYPDADRLLAHTEASLIVITAPNRAHFALAKAALEAGKDVLVEKPLAISAAEGRELQALAVRLQRRLAVFHNRRYDDDFMAVRQLLQTAALGCVQLMYARFDRFRPLVQARWKESAEKGNGVLYDLAPHLLDQTIALFGRPDALSARCLGLREGSHDAVDYFQLTLEYAAKPASASSGATPERQVVLSSSPYCAHPAPRFELHGSTGSFYCTGLDPQEHLLRQALQQDADNPTAVFTTTDWQHRHHGRFGELWRADGRQQWPFPPSSYAGFYQQLALYLHNQGDAPVSLTDALLGLELMELALESSQSGRRLAVS